MLSASFRCEDIVLNDLGSSRIRQHRRDQSVGGPPARSRSRKGDGIVATEALLSDGAPARAGVLWDTDARRRRGKLQKLHARQHRIFAREALAPSLLYRNEPVAAAFLR